MRSRSFVFPTSISAGNLREFAEAIEKVDLFSLYHHIFESRLRLGRESNDFSFWLESELGETALARSIARLDPYTHTLEGLRTQILGLVRQRLVSMGKVEAVHAFS
jgi:hypothetical protein